MTERASLFADLHIQAQAAEDVLTRYLSGSAVSREEMYAVRDGLQVTLNALSSESPATAVVEDAEVEVSPATMLLLRQLAREMECTPNAVLEEAIREMALNG